jgi:nicotinamide-nucleotide adenylyltransferase
VNRGLLVGRFQPFHKGHLHAVQEILDKDDEIIVAIGSAQCSHTIDDPFTASERFEMIRNALTSSHLEASRYFLIPVTDINDHRLWVSHVVTLVPRFDVVFSNKPLVKVLFSEAGYKVQPMKFHHRELYSATDIRKKIISGDEEWKTLVPKEVSDFILSIKGDERLRKLSGTDSE